MFSKKSECLLIILSVIVACQAQFDYGSIQLNGTCPKIEYVKNLDLPRIIGWYYRVFSNLHNTLCYQDNAQTMFAASKTATAIDVAFCCQSATNRSVSVCGEDVGSGVVAALPTIGEFTYQVKDNIYPNFILDTDYDHYTIVYGCKPGANNKRDEVIFIYSRTYTLAPVYRRRVASVLAKNGIKFSDAKPVKQGDNYPYLPKPRQ